MAKTKKDMKRHTVPQDFGQEQGQVHPPQGQTPPMPTSSDQFIQPKQLQLESGLCNQLSERNSQVLQLLSRLQQVMAENKGLRERLAQYENQQKEAA